MRRTSVRVSHELTFDLRGYPETKLGKKVNLLDS
jgi:hypothetical protein